jgi:hypothetical protein
MDYIVRRARRIRQLVPTKFATAYVADPDGRNEPTFCTWWMWLGRSFAVKRIVIA